MARQHEILGLIKSFEKLPLRNIWFDSCFVVSLISFIFTELQKGLEKITVLIAQRIYDGRHTGEYMAVVLETLFSSWEIPNEKVINIIRDGGTYLHEERYFFVKGYKYSLFSHQIQIVVMEGLKSYKSMIAINVKR